jgi:hypothetical protein
MLLPIFDIYKSGAAQYLNQLLRLKYPAPNEWHYLQEPSCERLQRLYGYVALSDLICDLFPILQCQGYGQLLFQVSQQHIQLLLSQIRVIFYVH